MQKMRIVVIMMLLGLFLVACGNSAATDTESGGETTTDVQEDTQSAEEQAPKPEDSGASEDNTAPMSDEWSGSSFNANLDALDSYTAVFTYEQGEGDAKQVWSWQQRVTRDPRAKIGRAHV